ncbi:hypothetical protein HPT29_027625 (plasmid) [Microvirga terrae]|uniref:Uncharacterized protein n=1 Tax=Microvirga terrae TaxID=2740529 RepID=A0ABY5S2Q8_9HYPH|nr:hypothetical protein [Microvirga terrae]UVF22791.1 hypothetical protein HPT29_027625 [Microvirga terrae]
MRDGKVPSTPSVNLKIVAGHSQPDEEQRQRAEKQRHRFEERQLEAIRQRIARKPLMKRRSERRQVANNLWRILESLEAGQPSIKRKDVLQAAGQGGEHDSTKRLPRFAINPDLQPAEQEERAEAATQDIRKYLKIARTAARLAGHLEEDAFLRQLVSGTSFLTGVFDDTALESSDEDLIQHTWDDLEIALEMASRAMVDRLHLNDHLIKAQHIRLRRNLTGAWESSTRGTIDSILAPQAVRDGDLPPCPSVFLGVVSGFDPAPCQVSIELSDAYGDLADDLKGRLIDAGLSSRTFEANAHPVFWVWLELGPFGPGGRIIPAFRLKARTLLVSAETVDDYQDFGAGAGCISGQLFGEIDETLPTDGSAAFVSTERYDTFGAAAFDPETESMVGIHLYVTLNPGSEWLERYAASLHGETPGFDSSLILSIQDPRRTVLQAPISEGWLNFHGSGIRQNLKVFCYSTVQAMRETGQSSRPAEIGSITPFDPRSLVAAIERSLFMAPDAARLDRLLETSARELADELDAVLAAWDQERSRRLSAFLADYT